MRAPDAAYEAYLAEIDRYLKGSRAFAEELKGLEREWAKVRAASSRRREQELKSLEERVRDAEKSYERTARMLSDDGLRSAGALIPTRVRPVAGGGSLEALLVRHAELTGQIERLARRYAAESTAEGVSEQRASEALEARRRVLQEQLAQEEGAPPVEAPPARASGCLSHAAAFVLVALAAVGRLLMAVV